MIVQTAQESRDTFVPLLISNSKRTQNTNTDTAQMNTGTISSRPVEKFGSQVPFYQNLMGDTALRDTPGDYEI